MSKLPNWPSDNPKWDEKSLESLLNIEIDTNLTKKKVKIEEIINNTDKFPIKFPIETVKIKNLKNHKDITVEMLNRNTNSVYAFVHERVLELFAKFLELKKNYGTVVERAFYKDMNLKDFVNRLINKRAVYFYAKHDRWCLLNKAQGLGDWENIGTKLEKEPLVLKDCLSYDEIKMSAFLYVSSYTYFLNKGDRYNKGIHNRTNIEQDGIIVGMIGARFDNNKMDFEDICFDNDKRTPTNAQRSVSDLMKEFYEEEKISSYWTNKNNARFTNIKCGVFDNIIYHKRLAIAFDSLLLEASFRAKAAGKKCFLHVVGLGLGHWMISRHQSKLFQDSFYNRILSLGGEKLGNISDIYFARFSDDNIGGVKDGELIQLDRHPLGGIRIHIGQREPHEKLTGDNEGKLLVVSYAWDGNALPGNEFWRELLSGSGDSAAACSTQIAELHNPHINPQLCADNLRVICHEDGQVLRIQEYADRKATETKKKYLIELLKNKKL